MEIDHHLEMRQSSNEIQKILPIAMQFLKKSEKVEENEKKETSIGFFQ